jgi:hypothetical protein
LTDCGQGEAPVTIVRIERTSYAASVSGGRFTMRFSIVGTRKVVVMRSLAMIF